MCQGVDEMMEAIKEQMKLINSGRRYETVIVGGGGELENIEDEASRILECPVRIYRPTTIGVRQMAYTANLGLIYYLAEQVRLTGKRQPSVVLPEMSNTMLASFKGLTKITGSTNHGEKKLNKMLDVLFSEDE